MTFYITRVLLIILILSGVSLFANDSLGGNKKINIGFLTKHKTLDHTYATASGTILLLSNTTEGLTRYDKHGRLIAGAAKSWDVSDDGKVYTFHLRDGLKWSDGQPLTAHDFITTFKHIHDARYNKFSKATYLFNFILNSKAILEGNKPLDSLGAKALDDKTLEISLESAIPFFPAITAYPSFAPTPNHIFKHYGESWSDVSHIVTSGAYDLISASASSVLLKKNAYYYDANNVYFEEVNIKYFDHHNMASHSLMMGNVDVVGEYRQLDIKSLDSVMKDKISLVARKNSVTGYLVLNQKDKLFQDERLGQALSISIDKQHTANTLGNNEAAYSFAIPSKTSGWKGVKPLWANYTRKKRIKLAQSLMKELGYAPFKRLKLNVKVNDNGSLDKINNKLKENWSDIWVDVRFIVQKTKVHYRDLKKGEFQVGYAAWGADYDDPLTFLSLYHSASAKNYANWKNKQYDQLLNDLEKLNYTVKERFSLYRKMEKIIMKYSPIIPLHYGGTYYLVSSDLNVKKINDTMPTLIQYLKPR